MVLPLIPIYIILTTSAIYYTKQTIQKKKKQQQQQDDESNHYVSSRGLKQLKPPLPYLNSFIRCLEVSYLYFQLLIYSIWYFIYLNGILKSDLHVIVDNQIRKMAHFILCYEY